MKLCPDCEKAKEEPDYPVFAKNCQGCIKRQLESINKPKPEEQACFEVGGEK